MDRENQTFGSYNAGMMRKEERMVRFYYMDSGDIFFTENLLQLDFRQYMYYQLYKEGYDGVYFLETRTMDTVNVLCETEKSCSIYADASKVWGFPRPSFTKEDIGGRQSFILSQKWKNAWAAMKKMILNSSGKRYAFIFSMGDFLDLFKASYAMELRNNLDEQRWKKGISFILTDTFCDGKDMEKLWEIVLTKEKRENILETLQNLTPEERLEKMQDWKTEEIGTWDRTQMMRLIRRVYLNSARYIKPQKAEQIAGLLCSGQPEDIGRSVFGTPIHSRREFYRLLTDGKSLDDFEKKILIGRDEAWNLV